MAYSSDEVELAIIFAPALANAPTAPPVTSFAVLRATFAKLPATPPVRSLAAANASPPTLLTALRAPPTRPPVTPFATSRAPEAASAAALATLPAAFLTPPKSFLTRAKIMESSPPPPLCLPGLSGCGVGSGSEYAIYDSYRTLFNNYLI